MRNIRHALTIKPLGTISAIALCITMSTVSCSLAETQVLPANLETRILSAKGTADDHLTAAHLYQLEAERLADEASVYIRKADSLSPIEDTKGFRRDALKTAGHQRQKQAEKLLQLADEYQRKAQAMTAQQ